MSRWIVTVTMNARSTPILGIVLLAVGGAACRPHPAAGPEDVTAALIERTGHGPASGQPARTLPDGVHLDDGLTSDESVAIALWNHHGFRSDLARLGFARADLVQAGLLRNPVLSLLFPWGPKQFEAAVTAPLGDLCFRRRRVALAQTELQRVAADLVRHGLDLALAAKLAHTEWVLAGRDAATAQRAVDLREALLQIETARFREGDIGEHELLDARASLAHARLAAGQRQADRAIAGERLRALLGLEEAAPELVPGMESSATPELPDLPRAIEIARITRPDLRAAELGVEAAGRRAGLAREDVLAISAVVDLNETTDGSLEAGPGATLAIPLFDRGRAREIRGKAGLEQATHDYLNLKDSVVSSVRETYTRLRAAQDSLETVRSTLLAIRRDAVEQAEQAFAAGEIAYFVVVRARLDLLGTETLHRDAEAAVLRARAGLEHAIGTDLDPWTSPSATERR